MEATPVVRVLSAEFAERMPTYELAEPSFPHPIKAGIMIIRRKSLKLCRGYEFLTMNSSWQTSAIAPRKNYGTEKVMVLTVILAKLLSELV